MITKKVDDIIFNDNLDTTSNFDFLEFFQNKILIKRGDFSITEDLIIPKDPPLKIVKISGPPVSGRSLFNDQNNQKPYLAYI